MSAPCGPVRSALRLLLRTWRWWLIPLVLIAAALVVLVLLLDTDSTYPFLYPRE